MLKNHRMFWLGFSAALGGILAVTVTAFAASPTPTTVSRHAVKRAAVHVPAGPAASALGVLQRAATAADVLPSAMVAASNGIMAGSEALSADVQPGALVAVKSRRLLTGLGTDRVSLYAVPTSKGAVCTVFSGVYGSAGCFSDFTAQSPISYDVRDVDQVGAGLPAIVDGLVPNDVVGVDVLVGGVAHAAKLANNAFFYELPDATAWPDALVVSYSDGTSQTISIAGVPARH